jgi:hypothetical protein
MTLGQNSQKTFKLISSHPKFANFPLKSLRNPANMHRSLEIKDSLKKKVNDLLEIHLRSNPTNPSLYDNLSNSKPTDIFSSQDIKDQSPKIGHSPCTSPITSAEICSPSGYSPHIFKMTHGEGQKELSQKIDLLI